MSPVANSVAAVSLLLFPFLLSASPDPDSLNDDVLGLIVFRANLFDPESRLASWNEDDATACEWVGVGCDPDTRRVSTLNLDGLSLSGRIGKSLIRLQYLQVLQLSRNNFSGTLNPILAKIPSLRVVDLSENSFAGPIPDDLFQQCGSLREIYLARNGLTGSIPQSVSSCTNLERFDVSSNRLSGELPSGLWSLSSLRSLNLSDNVLEGEIPEGIDSLYNLEVFNSSRNNFVGWLPVNIGNCFKLKYIDFCRNQFRGTLPVSIGKLGSSCRYLDVNGNFLAGGFPDWIGKMESLEFLDLSGNSFYGRIPTNLGNLQSLRWLNLSGNEFEGNLPGSLGNCFNLRVVDASRNSFSGNLPPWVFQSALETISLAANRYSGSISLTPFYLQSYHTLQVLDLSSNSLTGGIPSAIGNFIRMQSLNLSRNYLVGQISSCVFELNTTSVLDLSHNKLSGSIPVEIGHTGSLQELRLESNFLNGVIPLGIGNCSSLTALDLSRNNLTGPIPIAITILSNLEFLDMSFNNLSGSLPKELINLSQLVMFNVSFNHLNGELPIGGFFNTISPSSVVGNPTLCGSVIKLACPSIVPAKPIVLNPNTSKHYPNSHHKRIALSISVLIAIGAAVFIALGVVTVSILNMHVRTSMARAAAAFAFSRSDDYSPSHESEPNYGKLVMFSGDADFAPGAQGLLNKDSELGQGGFGSVYMTEVQNKRSIAIKKLNTTSLVKCQEDFEREIKKLGKIGHENLVALEGYYWTSSLQLLINEYVAGGSLYKHLHERDESGICLTWQQRFKIIIGTAKGLAHLHRNNVIHYNMKSSNVLINSSGEPKVGDFGLARLLPVLDRYILSIKIQSALGYMAPELACQTVKITEKCDVYGFGILTLEVITGKRPVEYMEDDVVMLCDMVRQALDEGRIEECIDKKLKGIYLVEEAIPVVKLGLICASQVPSNRPDMEEVTNILEMIKCPTEGHEELEEFST